MDVILLLKLAHIASAIVAVGANLTYAFWIRRAEKDPQHLAWTIGTIRRLDNAVAGPAYVLVLITGILMIVGGHFSFSVSWIQLAIALYLVVVIVAMAAFAPTLRRQLDAASNPGSAEYRALASRSAAFGWLTMAIVLVIAALMVFKPTLW